MLAEFGKFVFVLLQIAYVLAQNDGSQQTALDEFVFSDESLSQFSFYHSDGYDWVGTNSFTSVGYTVNVLNVTSGEWRTEAEVGSGAHWWHILALVIPDNLNPAYASHVGIWVTGECNDENDGMPELDGFDIELVTTLATGIGMPFAALFQVPNCPIVFDADPEQRERTGDALLAFSFDEYLNDTSTPELNALLPMARAAIRSMDAMTQFSEDSLTTTIEKFIVTGGSKRGWTSWLAGALDNTRVEAIVPTVWDCINVAGVFHHQYRNYEGWSFGIGDYIENHLPERLDTPEMIDYQNLIDPYFYRTRLTMPKLVLTALMDEAAGMPDDEQYWWDLMPEPKWLLKVPNTEHTFVTGVGEAAPVLGTWITYVLNDWEMPHLSWDYNEDNGDITVHTLGGEVYSASLWKANSCPNGRRDFRIFSLDNPCECGTVFPTEEVGDLCMATDELWHREDLAVNGDGTYTGHVDALGDGRWTAFMVDIQFTTEHTNIDDPMHNIFTRGERLDGDKVEASRSWPFAQPGILEFTSRGSVVPTTFPFDDCTQDGCIAPLV